MAKEFTDKQQAFINVYLKCWNATQAALEAGYSQKTAYSSGQRLLKDVEIAAEISRRIAEMTLSADESLVAMSEIARGDIGDFVEVQSGVPVINFDKAKKSGKLKLVKKITYGKGTIAFELYDRQRAIETMGKHHGLWKDGVQINVNVDLVIQLVDLAKAKGVDPADLFNAMIAQFAEAEK